MTYTLDFTGERYLPWLVEDDPFIGYEHVHRYLLASTFVKGKRVLDIACGEGYGAAMLARTARSVIGVDNDAETLRHAKRHHGKANIHFVQADAQQFALQENSVDVVVSYETLEHFAAHEPFLAAIRLALPDDGLLFISTPNRAMYSDDDHQENPFHQRELYRDEFVRLLRQHFSHVRLFGQSIMANSMIAETTGEYILRKRKNCRVRLTAIDESVTEYPDKIESNMRPRYYVAVCSNTEMSTLPDDLMVDDRATLVREFIDHQRRWATTVGDNTRLRAQAQHMEREMQTLTDQIQQTERTIVEQVQQMHLMVEQSQQHEQTLTDQVQQVHLFVEGMLQREQALTEQIQQREQIMVEQIQHNEQAMIEQVQGVHLKMIDEMNSVQQMLVERMEVILKREAEERVAFLTVQQQLLQRDQELIAMRETAEHLRDLATAKDRELQPLHAQSAELMRRTQEHERAIAEQNAHIQNLESYLAEQKRIVDEQFQQIHRAEENIAEQRRHYENALREIAQQATLIAERDEYIGVVTRALDEKNRHIGEFHSRTPFGPRTIVKAMLRKLVTLASS